MPTWCHERSEMTRRAPRPARARPPIPDATDTRPAALAAMRTRPGVTQRRAVPLVG